MTSISNTAPTALPVKAQASRAAWREEMLGQLLNSMREHKQPEPLSSGDLPAEKPLPLSGRGYYVDVYV